MELRRSKKFLLFALDVILAIVLILLLVRPWQSEPAPEPVRETYLSSNGKLFTKKTAEESALPAIDSLDPTTMTSEEGMSFLVLTLNSTTLDVYGDSLDQYGNRNPDYIAKNIDQVVSINGITDPALLLIFQIEKARVYANRDDFDTAWCILGQISEATLYDSQKSVYYKTMGDYYHAKGDTAKADSYYAKWDALPMTEKGGDE